MRKESMEREDVITGFDYRTHVIDKKDRKTVRYQPYTIEFHKGGQTIITRGGKQYSADGQEIVTAEPVKEIKMTEKKV